MKLRSFDSAFMDLMFKYDQLFGSSQFVAKIGGNTRAYLQGAGIPTAKIHDTIQVAHDEVKSGATKGQSEQINAKIFLSPDSHTQAAALTWSADLTHLIGMYPSSRMNQRARIGHSVTLSTLLTVSGFGNLLENLYFMYGLNNATDLNLLTVSGDRNTFRACHFGGPTNATPADESGYDLIRLNCGEVLFDKCTFGLDTIGWTAGDMLRFYGPADRSVRAIFKDCIFLMNADTDAVNFIETTSGQGRGFAFFDNCAFLNNGTSLVYGIDGAGLGNFKIYANISTFFAGCADIVAAAKEAYVLHGHGGWASADKLNNLLATNPDVS